MNYTFPLYVFLELIQYLIFADVILSWLHLVGLKWRPKFLAAIIDPLYSMVKKILPTSIGPIDFTPIVILVIILFLIGLIEIINPGSYDIYQSYIY